MHIILRDRGLAQWRAINSLSDVRLERLQARFVSEQPALAEFISRTAKPNSRPQSLIEFAGVLAEIFRREARHPLATATEDVVLAKWDGIVNFVLQFEESKKRDANTTRDIVWTCHQSNLMMGVTAGYLGEFEDKALVSDIGLPLLRLIVDCLDDAAGEPGANGDNEWTADRLEDVLSVQGDPMRIEALAASDSFQSELTPCLIEELEFWAKDPMGALDEDGSLGNHGMFLLGKWRVESAWPVFRKLFSLPGDIGYDLLGDLITEDGSTLLAMVVGRRRNELRAMVEDETLDEYCRNACIDALTCLVAWGEMPREEHVAYLRELLTTKLRGVLENEHTFAGAISAACDMEAWELQPEIEAACERGVVKEEFVDLDFFLQAKAGKYRNQWQAFCETHQPINDVIAATMWLDKPPERPEPLLPPPGEDFNVIAESDQPYIAPPKIGRNDPCSCGSGKKFKKCCGA